MPNNPRDKEDAFVVARLKNQTGSAEGPNLLPRQIGQFRVPLVQGLKLARTRSFFGGTEFTLVFNEPENIRFISRYNIYVLGLAGDNRQPLGPYSVGGSPAIVRVGADSATNVTLLVQTQLNNGYVSDLDSSPTVGGSTIAPAITSTDLGSIVVPIVNGGTNNSTPYTAGSVIFSNGTKLTENNSNLFWDDTNLRMLIRTKPPTLISNIATSSSTVANTTTPTTIFTGTIDANSASISNLFTSKLRGRYSTFDGVSTFSIAFKVGATTILTLTSVAALVTSSPLSCDFTITLRTLGATGTLWGFLDANINNTILSIPKTSTTTIDTTASMNVTAVVTWSAANLGNTLSIDQSYLQDIK